MTQTAELTTLHRAVEQLRSCVGEVHSRYGDTPHVRRLLGDVDRIDLDLSEFDLLPPPADAPRSAPLERIDDAPADPAMWGDDCDDEGIGGYHGSRGR